MKVTDRNAFLLNFFIFRFFTECIYFLSLEVVSPRFSYSLLNSLLEVPSGAEASLLARSILLLARWFHISLITFFCFYCSLALQRMKVTDRNAFLLNFFIFRFFTECIYFLSLEVVSPRFSYSLLNSLLEVPSGAEASLLARSILLLARWFHISLITFFCWGRGGGWWRVIGEVTTKYCYRLFWPFLIKGDIALNMQCRVPALTTRWLF